MRDGHSTLQGRDTSSASLRLNPERGAELLDAFMECPEPLALLDSDGRVDLANPTFLAQFGPSSMRASWPLNPCANNGWTHVQLPVIDAYGAHVRARALQLRQHTLLMVDKHGGRAKRDVDMLRRRLAEVIQLATTDYLTGAWNRSHFHHVIELELMRAATNRQPVALILFDIDHFKSINDRFGHAVGDRILRELATLVRHSLSAADALFRWGGEEFMVLVASAGYRRAQHVAEHLRQAVESYSFDSVGSVTVSLGVAEHDAREDIDSWFERLDTALAAAKKMGRNQVVVDRRGKSETRLNTHQRRRLEWDERYESGNARVDEEHRELFRLVNKLIDASLRAAANTAVLGSALDGLLDHVKAHFKEEEELLERLRYPELEEHRRAHRGLLLRAERMRERLLTGRVTVGAIVEFLAEDVVARHMLSVDRAFFPLFESQMIDANTDGDL